MSGKPSPGIVNQDDFSKLALKIRMEKIDKEEIKKLRKETITNEKYKTKMKKSVLEIQRVCRGYFARKKFKIVLDELNTETIIDYLNHKRIKRIHSQAKDIIAYYVNEYLNVKRQQKQKIIIAYFNYCADIIKTTYESYKIRKKIEPLLTLIRNHKAKIGNAINSFKVRLILRSSSMQNILVELANIKYCLNNMKKEDKNDLKTDFSIRLPKLHQMFYVEYYKAKKKKNWVSIAKTDNPWLLQYLSLIFKDNPKYTILNRRSKGEFNINNKTLSKKSFVKEEKDQVNKKFDDYDNKPIRPSNKNQMIEEENDSEFNPNNFEQKMGENGVIEINKGNKKRKKEPKQNPYDDYDNKPIKGKKIDFDELDVNELSVPPGNNDQIESYGSNHVDKPKRKLITETKKQKPKYDARKAIEEAKEKEAISGKKEIKSSFRDFVREMKNNAKGSPPIAQSGNLGGSIGNTVLNEANRPKSEKPKKEEEKKKIRKEPTEITMRKKLHELERSPPPRVIYIINMTINE